MKGYGFWLQLSAFQCRLSRKRHTELIGHIKELMNQGEDHVISFKLDSFDRGEKTIISLGKTFEPIERKPLIV
jgi:CRISPR-associated protein Cas2